MPSCKCGTNTDFLDDKGNKCPKNCVHEIAGLPCRMHINETYADTSSAYDKKRSAYSRYVLEDGTIINSKPYTVPSGRGGTGTYSGYTIPFEVASAHITPGHKYYNKLAELEDKYYNFLVMNASKASKKRKSGDADAPPKKQEQRSNCFGIQTKCITKPCKGKAWNCITGFRCWKCILEDFGGQWNEEVGGYLLVCPWTSKVGLAFPHPSGSITLEDIHFAAYGHIDVGSDRWKYCQSTVDNARARAAALPRVGAAPPSFDQEPASASFLAANVPSNIENLFTGFNLEEDVCNCSKGRTDPEGGLVRYEEFRNMNSEASNPLFLVPNEDGATGRSLHLNDYCKGGILDGQYEFVYSEKGTEQELLDVEQKTHAMMADVPGRMFENIGGGQRRGTRRGDFQVAHFWGKGWIDMVRNGELVLSLHRSGKMKRRLCQKFGLSIDIHFRTPDFNVHLIKRKYKKQRYAARRHGAPVFDDSFEEMANRFCAYFSADDEDEDTMEALPPAQSSNMALSANISASAQGSSLCPSSSESASSGLVSAALLDDTAHEDVVDDDVEEEDDRKMPAVDKDMKLSSTLSPQPTSNTLALSANISASAKGNTLEVAKTPHQGTTSVAEISPEEQRPKKKKKQSDLKSFFAK